ncbi:MAG TPA: helix-turn-helix domain-containing protein [Cyclobacteriaceae bacterium]
MSVKKLNSTNHRNRDALMNSCGLMYTLTLLSGRWKMKILYKLAINGLRFNELKKQIPHITDRMLTLHLKEMEENGLIKRTVYAEIPARVEYCLTPSTVRLIPVWENLEEWGNKHREEQKDLMVRTIAGAEV